MRFDQLMARLFGRCLTAPSAAPVSPSRPSGRSHRPRAARRPARCAAGPRSCAPWRAPAQAPPDAAPATRAARCASSADIAPGGGSAAGRRAWPVRVPALGPRGRRPDHVDRPGHRRLLHRPPARRRWPGGAEPARDRRERGGPDLRPAPPVQERPPPAPAQPVQHRRRQAAGIMPRAAQRRLHGALRVAEVQRGAGRPRVASPQGALPVRRRPHARPFRLLRCRFALRHALEEAHPPGGGLGQAEVQRAAVATADGHAPARRAGPRRRAAAARVRAGAEPEAARGLQEVPPLLFAVQAGAKGCEVSAHGDEFCAPAEIALRAKSKRRPRPACGGSSALSHKQNAAWRCAPMLPRPANSLNELGADGSNPPGCSDRN